MLCEFLHDLKTDPDGRVNPATHPDHQQTLVAMRQRGDARARLRGRFMAGAELATNGGTH